MTYLLIDADGTVILNHSMGLEYKHFQIPDKLPTGSVWKTQNVLQCQYVHDGSSGHDDKQPIRQKLEGSTQNQDKNKPAPLRNTAEGTPQEEQASKMHLTTQQNADTHIHTYSQMARGTAASSIAILTRFLSPPLAGRTTRHRTKIDG